MRNFDAYLVSSIAVLEECRRVWTQGSIAAAVASLNAAVAADRPLLICGNGGSASDAMHITGELVGRFLRERRPLNAICLSSNASVITAWANDYSYDEVFARQVQAHGRPGGVLVGLSTSGNSRNVVAAFEQARALQMTTIGLTGHGGGKMAPLSDHLFAVPSSETPLIQQAHICLYHHLCEAVEASIA
jgi:D-sedoheptulose 7-phosphate isomerase